MTVRLTEKRSMRADSLGRRAPGDSAPERISERSAAVTVVDRFEAMMPVSQFECVSTDGDRFRGPLARLFAERDAQPWAVRNDHATIGDLHPLVEEGIEPVEVLHPCLTRIAGGQVRMDLHGEVRGYIECGFVRKGEQAQKLADPTYARRVRLKDVTGSASDEATMIGHCTEHLSGGDRRVKSRGPASVALAVVGIVRLLDPTVVVLLARTFRPQTRDTVPHL